MDRREKKALMARLERDALRICARFRLRYRVLEPERANVKSRYGVCFSDGTIRIRLTHATTKRPLKYSSLVNTLCHELAHLRHFNHGPRFQAFYAQILEWARREGIYRPGPEPRRAEAPPANAAARPASGAPVRSRTGRKPKRTAVAPPELPLIAGAEALRKPARPRPASPGKPAPPTKTPRPANAQLELFG